MATMKKKEQNIKMKKRHLADGRGGKGVGEEPTRTTSIKNAWYDDTLLIRIE